MPLDPFFSERLRVHRRYLIQRNVDAFRARVAGWLGVFGGAGAAEATGTAVQASGKATGARGEAGDGVGGRSPGAAPAASAQVRRAPQQDRARARARHRRAALAWDRTELATVGTPGPDLRIVDHKVPVAGYPAVRVRLYYPDGADAETLPAWLTFFGGAFRQGGIDYPTTDAACRRRAAEAGVVMVAVDYALAPEHRFPTQVEQAHAALMWLHENAPSLGVDRERLGIAGTSAGGCIAAALTLANRERSALPIRLQLLEVPVTDLTGAHIDLAATRALGIPSFLAMRELRSIAGTYLPRKADGRNELASPLRAASHAGLPEAVILTAEYDPLRRDGAEYGARLRAAGVAATVVRYQGVSHDAAIYTGALSAAREWHRQVVGVLARLHEA
ncbi:alpha/beta hydrolase [Microbacterium sp. zg.Y625]|uniref:alpha/beta hydrolase n=1 Tax=Microbacterium jiangjiandongii TaxID=3049071 RepID=UPI00214B4170|nr:MULTISPECIES: alpha/beta hydrolase [unclassified Microbacterium]MCR2794197.1 alpha/beta hydrolase [Microbacterium sp. zg.Y625]WIM25509.1 alpha/beta hydrolase [Microbacterium sp. zg-Y625]